MDPIHGIKTGRIILNTWSRWKNRIIAKLITRFPSLSKRFVDDYNPWESEGVPWTPVTKPLAECRLALVTTAGVHHRDQEPFDMNDPDGDPTFRELDGERPETQWMITHDYYDHKDADKDLNIVFPLARLKEFQEDGLIGEIARYHYSFMGHIDGGHLPRLIEESGPEVARRLKDAAVDVVLLTPG